MNNDMIRMPEAEEIRDDLAAARTELETAIKENEEVAAQSKFVMEVLAILEAKVAAGKDLNKLDRKDQVSIIAHLNLFYSLLDDLFGDDFEEFDDEDFNDEDLVDGEEEEIK